MNLIDIRQLRAFQLLARTGSFTIAAKQMFVTQSAVSHSIKALEKSLGCSLLDRAGKSVALTVHGETLLRRVDTIISEMQLATTELETLNRWGHGRLRIGATDTMCQYLLPAVLREFRESFPNCEVAIHAADTEELIRQLDAGKIDLVLGLRPATDETGVDFRKLFTDELVFAVSPLHPWASSKKIPEEGLEAERFITYAPRSPTNFTVGSYFRKRGVHNPKLTELGNMEAIKELSKIGMGIGIMAPWVIREETAAGHLICLTPPGGSMTRDWGVILRGRGENITMMGETFTGICRTIARGLETPAMAVTIA